MVEAETLRETVAGFYGVPAEALHDGFALSTPERQGSIARYALDGLIRRELGVRSRAVHTARTYGELERALLDGSAPKAGAAQRGSKRLDRVSCGIDMESIDALPETDDYFGHVFYVEHFTRGEIGYC